MPALALVVEDTDIPLMYSCPPTILNFKNLQSKIFKNLHENFFTDQFFMKISLLPSFQFSHSFNIIFLHHSDFRPTLLLHWLLKESSQNCSSESKIDNYGKFPLINIDFSIVVGYDARIKCDV